MRRSFATPSRRCGGAVVEVASRGQLVLAWLARLASASAPAHGLGVKLIGALGVVEHADYPVRAHGPLPFCVPVLRRLRRRVPAHPADLPLPQVRWPARGL